MFLVNSRRPQSLHVFLSRFTFKLRQSWFATLYFSSYPGIKIPRDLHSFNGVIWTVIDHLWCLSMLQRVFRHGPRSMQVSTKQSDPHVSILSLILWSLLLSLVALLCDNQGVPSGPAGFLSFSINLWSHLGGQKDFSVFCSWERCSGVASILCNPYAPTSTSTVL